MYEDLLRRVRPFIELDKDELHRLANAFSERLLPAGHHIYRIGDTPNAFYVVREGEVALYRDKPGSPTQLQAHLGPGDFFGETGLFDDAAHTVSASTNVTSRILEIRRKTLLDFLDDHPEVALRLQMAAARRHSQNVSDALELGRRNEVRISLALEANLRLEGGAINRRVKVENLSLGGVCLRDVPLAWDRHWTVRFTLLFEGLELPVIGRVAWRRGDAVGIAFTRTDSAHEDRVQAMMRRLKNAAGT
jgi:CRP-like cAMP-binding protein